MHCACVHSFICLKCDERHLVIVDQQFLKFVQLALRTVRAPVEGTFDLKQPWNQWWISLSCAHFAVDSSHRFPGRFIDVGFNFKLRNLSLEFSFFMCCINVIMMHLQGWDGSPVQESVPCLLKQFHFLTHAAAAHLSVPVTHWFDFRRNVVPECGIAAGKRLVHTRTCHIVSHNHVTEFTVQQLD